MPAASSLCRLTAALAAATVSESRAAAPHMCDAAGSGACAATANSSTLSLNSSSAPLPAPAPLQLHRLAHPLLTKHGVTVDVLRHDLAPYPHLAGNKWHKLKYNLLHAALSASPDGSSSSSSMSSSFSPAPPPLTVVSFGGAYSNHLYALARAGAMFGYQTVGIVRGDKPTDYDQLQSVDPIGHSLSAARPPTLNPLLRIAAFQCGMQLHFCSDRRLYRRLTQHHSAHHLLPPLLHAPSQQQPLLSLPHGENSHELLALDRLQQQLGGPCVVIPEGAGNVLGALGCMDMVALPSSPLPFSFGSAYVPSSLTSSASSSSTLFPYDVVCVACGTGTTLAGLIMGLSLQQHQQQHYHPRSTDSFSSSPSMSDLPSSAPRVLGFVVLKGDAVADSIHKQASTLLSEIQQAGSQYAWLTPYSPTVMALQEAVVQLASSPGGPIPLVSWDLVTGYHHGGYARSSSALDSFLLQMRAELKVTPVPPPTFLGRVDASSFASSFASSASSSSPSSSLPLDHVYTGKLLFGVFDWINRQSHLDRPQRVLVIHSGGVTAEELQTNHLE